MTLNEHHSRAAREVRPPLVVICKDETENVDAEQFQKRLRDMFRLAIRMLAVEAQIDRIRWRLFPEGRISQRSLF